MVKKMKAPMMVMHRKRVRAKNLGITIEDTFEVVVETETSLRVLLIIIHQRDQILVF